MNETRMEKFNAKCTDCGGNAIAEVEIYNEEYVSLLKKNFNSSQQLKAEIAALADEVFQMSLLHPSEQKFSDIVDRMRQLSDV